MLRCPACGRTVQRVKGTLADYYCALCDEVFDVEELDAEVETMETIFMEIAFALQHRPNEVVKSMSANAPADYADGVLHAAAYVAWALQMRVGRTQ